MSISSEILRRLSALEMSREALGEVLSIIADIQAADEARKGKDRERKRLSKEIPRNVQGNGVEIPADALSPKKAPPDPLKEEPLFQKENPPKGGQKKGASREDFERFKAVYPRRKGSNPTEPAWQKFDAAVRSGEVPEAIIAAAQRYGAEEASLGHAGTPFVKQMQVWLNQKCWRDYPEPSVVEQFAVCPGTVRIKRTDHRWEFFAARYRRDHQGRAPPVTDESWYFPEEWLREVEAGTAA
jgi:hypothetical protein